MLRRAPKTFLSATAIAAALALTLSGCSSNNGAAAEPEEGPLSKYLSTLWDGEEWTEEKMQEQQVKTEDLIAACMQKEGFEYKPNVQSMGGMVSTGDDDGPEWGSKEFAEQYGYGFSDNPAMSQIEESPDAYFDPNEEYVNSLSESEREAFYETLNGPTPTEEEYAAMEEEGGYSPNMADMGCWGAAYTEVNAGTDGYQAASEDPEFVDLFEGINNVWNMEDNDDMQQLNSEWAACMADAGYPDFKTADDAQMSIMDEQNALYNYDDLADGEEPKEPKKADLDALKKKEIEIATADFSCKEKVDYVKKSTKIMHAVEQAFVDENKAQLDAMVAKYQVSSGSKTEEK
ncbi:hypothetical protein ACFSWE_11330 [Leucobacter albus]|uniref:Uncharacterized protein n=1 Tax=Leucobacter albus TaxID=272210 RepID=A0ABW3TQD2_9MICO